MLDQFQVCDLPLFDVVLCLESTPLKHACGAIEASECRAVLVVDEAGSPRGLVMRDSVTRHASRLSDMRVGLLPALGVVALAPETSLDEAARKVSAAGVGAIACRLSQAADFGVMLRDEMLNLTDWRPLLQARARRLSTGHTVVLAAGPAGAPPAVIAL